MSADLPLTPKPQPEAIEEVKDTTVEDSVYPIVHHLYLTAWADGRYEDTSQMTKKVDETYLAVLALVTTQSPKDES